MSEQQAVLKQDVGQPFSILCVDDEAYILKALTRLFRDEPYRVLTATSGQAGLELLQRSAGIGLILRDQRMPAMTGTGFLVAARALAPDIPRIILTAYSEESIAVAAINQGGAYRYLLKPWNEKELLLAVRDGVQRYRLLQENLRLNEQVRLQKEELDEWNANLIARVLQQTGIIRQKLEETHRQELCGRIDGDAVVLMFSRLQELRHPPLSRHSHRVAELTASMAATLRFPHQQAQELKNAALLHDIGQLCLPDQILFLKPQQIRDDYTAEYRSHAIKGEAMLKPFEELHGVGRLIRHHHEEFSGGGFPDGLAGWEIPLGSQLIRLAGFIDQSYAPADEKNAKFQVTQKLAAVMGSFFDPALAPAAYLAVNEVLI